MSPGQRGTDIGAAATVGGAIFGGFLLMLVSAAIFALFYGWILMLLLGTLHLNISPAVPLAAYEACVMPAFLIRILVTSASTTKVSST